MKGLFALVFLAAYVAVSQGNPSFFFDDDAFGLDGSERPSLNEFHVSVPNALRAIDNFQAKAREVDSSIPAAMDSPANWGTLADVVDIEARNAFFSHDTVVSLASRVGFDLTGVETKEVYSAKEFKSIVGSIQNATLRDARNKMSKAPYCHPAEDNSASRYYIALIVGTGQDGDNQGHEGHGDYKMCDAGHTLEDADCYNCAMAAIGKYDAYNSVVSQYFTWPHFWDQSSGCPGTGSGCSEVSCTVISRSLSHFAQHGLVRLVTDLKLYSVFNEGEVDEVQFCSDFAQSQYLTRSGAANVKADHFLNQPCETQVRELKKAVDINAYTNPFQVARDFIMPDQGFDGDLKNLYPREKNCMECLSRTYLAALDLGFLDLRNIELTDTQFHALENSLHPTSREMSVEEVGSLMSTYREMVEINRKKGRSPFPSAHGTAKAICSCDYELA